MSSLGKATRELIGTVFSRSRDGDDEATSAKCFIWASPRGTLQQAGRSVDRETGEPP